VLLGEPARTEYDWNFQLLGIPIRVSPWFWALAALLGLQATSNDFPLLLMWVLAVLLSIVVHELGHSLCFRYYRIHSHIVLYHFGGLAIPDSFQASMGYGGRSRPGQQLAIAAAGPAAQLGLALLVIVLLRLGGYTDGFVSNYVPPSWTADPVQEAHVIWEAIEEDKREDQSTPQSETIGTLPEKYQQRWRLADHDGDQEVTKRELYATVLIPSRELKWFVYFLLVVSILWALLNLMPVYPLDGGQIARELFLLSGSRQAIQHSLMLSIAVGVALGLWGLRGQQPFMGMMFLMLAYSSYTTLQQYTGRGGFGGGNPW
jgi:Zn-dependent protease